MPKRNIVWIAVGAIVAVLLWKVPEAIIRRDALYSQFGPLLDVRVQILRNYVEPLDEQVLLRGAIDGMLNRLDPYSEYYSAQEYEQFSKRTEGQFYGIGIEVGELESGEMVVVSPIEGSPAFRAGLRAQDRITRIDGKRTTDLTLVQGVGLITGEPGTPVTLTVYRPSTSLVFDKTIKRELVRVPTVRGWARSQQWEWDYLIDPDLRIGYVRILSFERTTAEQLDAVLRKLLARNRIRGLVLDVRDNPGGLLDVVVHIANGFLAEGKIVSTEGRTSAEQLYYATRGDTYPDIPLVILVNRGSASASEILAGSLQDHRRAKVVGEQTFGKGSVQAVFPVENNHGAVKLTTGYYYLPNGERIHGRGVTPDETVELTAEEQAELHASQLSVYSTSRIPTTTQVTTSTAPAGGPVEIIIDRQLQAGLDILRRQLRPASADN